MSFAPAFTFKNSGFQPYYVSLVAGKRGTEVSPFKTVTMLQSRLAEHDYSFFISGYGKRRPQVFKVTIDRTTGLVSTPQWTLDRSNGSTEAMDQVFRSETPWELRSWTTFLGVPWFCWAGTVGIILVGLLVVIIILAVRRSKGGGQVVWSRASPSIVGVPEFTG